MAEHTPGDRDRAQERIGTATASLAILATGAAGALSILAWHASTEASAVAVTPAGQFTGQAGQQGGDDGGRGDDGGGRIWSILPGGDATVPPGGIDGAPPPQQGSGRGAVGSQGS